MTRAGVRTGAVALLAVLIAAPGVHLFERWMAHPTAFWVSHTLALLVLAASIWSWRSA